jgi:hypothetical protein
MSSRRYALYVAPPTDSDLWRFGCEVIGRDALTGDALEGFAPEGHEPEAWRALTSDPRRYGFHATLKAPFHLRADLDVVDLMDHVAAFGAMATDDGRASVVLKPKGQSKSLRSLEEATVRGLEAVRAPLTQEERVRCNVARLSPRQRYYLEAWGYPYVIGEFRPHFTLSNAVPDPAPIVKSLEWEFSLRVASRAMRVDALTLFGEMSPGGDFRILRCFPLGRSQRQRRLSSRVAAAAFID